jgi:hypothetical protein
MTGIPFFTMAPELTTEQKWRVVVECVFNYDHEAQCMKRGGPDLVLQSISVMGIDISKRTIQRTFKEFMDQRQTNDVHITMAPVKKSGRKSARTEELEDIIQNKVDSTDGSQTYSEMATDLQVNTQNY